MSNHYNGNFFSKVILKVFRVNKKNTGSDNLSNEEIKTIIKESSSKITENYEEMVLNLLDLQKVTVEHAMIPKNDVEGIDIDDTSDNINKKLCQTKLFHQYVLQSNYEKNIA